MAASVAFERVTKRFGASIAVRDISFRVEPGSLVTLLGPSGCGKTTTLRMIAGLELPSDGRISIDERDVTRVSASERDVTMVFQSYALFPHMTVLENVGYGLSVRGKKPRETDEAALHALELVGLEGFGARQPSALSGGQQQRVAVARALVLEPKVLLLDEPLSNLDAKLRRRMREDIRELQQKLGVTTVYVTHDQTEALSISDKIIVMDRGVIAQEGTPRELYESPASAFIARFIGEANLVHASLRRTATETCAVDLGGYLLEIPDRGQSEGEVLVSVRPEAIQLEPAESGALGGVAGGGLAGTVTRAVYLGDYLEYTVATAAGELLVVSRAPSWGSAEIARGACVRVRFDERRIAILPRNADLS